MIYRSGQLDKYYVKYEILMGISRDTRTMHQGSQKPDFIHPEEYFAAQKSK
jgi:hypothetical protein